MNVEGVIEQKLNTEADLIDKGILIMKSIFEILKLVSPEPRRLVKIVGDKSCDTTCKKRKNWMEASSVMFIIEAIFTEVASKKLLKKKKLM